MSAPLNPDPTDWSLLKQQLAALDLQLQQQSAMGNPRSTALLQQRSIQLAAVEVPPPQQLAEVLRFRLGTEQYAIESSYVSRVLPLPQITALFDVPGHIAGICYVRGRVVSVLDIRAMFQLPAVTSTDQHILVILKDARMEFALWVDAITGIQQLDLIGLQTQLPNLDPLRLRYLRGVTQDQTVFLDGEALLNDPDLIVRQESES